MFFYKVKAIMKTEEKGKEDRAVIKERLMEAITKSQEFNTLTVRDSYYFISLVDKYALTLGIVSENPEKIKEELSEFISYIGLDITDTDICLDITDIDISEVTFSTIVSLIDNAKRYGYIENTSEILDKFDLNRLRIKRGIGALFEDSLIKDSTKEEIYESASKYLMKDTFIPELDRIYTKNQNVCEQGHPVHYMIETDDPQACNEINNMLLCALYENNRLDSKRYAFIDVSSSDRSTEEIYEHVYKISIGGALIIHFTPNDDALDSAYSSSDSTKIKCICQIAKKYSNQVLTVICLPRECTKAKNLFFKNLDKFTLIELKEDLVKGERAKDFLKTLAKSVKTRTDKKLFDKLDENESYLASELHDIFDEWYNSKLKTSVFPQYRDIESIRIKDVKAAPQGTAYEELNEMVGLDEAKNAINNAVNYYKMQKIFKENGIKTERPAMHMVFTGNPGTAKTTAARLFASIMKDNGLLSKGQLIEVGRADLVGKYVGETAQLVRMKFIEASGGVLFIDEAYSLVDAKDGYYGDEAISTIVQEMENRRDSVVVIFAGYPDKMEEFLKKNPGLRSRIAFHIHFDDYNTDELLDIARIIGRKKGLQITDGAASKLRSIFEIVNKESDFGNGRYVRNVLEQARMAQAARLMKGDLDSLTRKELTTITAEDVVISEKFKPEKFKPARKTIGFAY